MSGVFGLFNQDGAAVSRGELESMASLLERRGPDRTAYWREDFAGLGLTLLATTPELAFERQPVQHAATGCVITADVRLDNRDELLSTLGLRERAGLIGDAGLILEAYLAWGEDCVARFLGDFAFVLWDPRNRKLFGARDHFGMRPFYYHHTPGRFFAFASEPKAILVLPRTPYRINEGRIAEPRRTFCGRDSPAAAALSAPAGSRSPPSAIAAEHPRVPDSSGFRRARPAR